MKDNSIAFKKLKRLSLCKINEMTYPQLRLNEWEKGNISLIQNNKVPIPQFIKGFIAYKKRPESSRCLEPRYFGEAYVATKLSNSTKEGWYSSFQWLYAKKWLTENIGNDPFESQFYEEALKKYILKEKTGKNENKLKKLKNVWDKIDGFPSNPRAPDLWLVDHKGKHHFIEVKTWRWDPDKKKWNKDTPSDEQLAGLALIEKYLKQKVYILWLYPEEKQPFASWKKYIDKFNSYCNLLKENLDSPRNNG